MSILNIKWEQLGQLLLDKLIYILIASLLFYIFYKLVAKIVSKLFKNYAERSWTDTQRIVTFSRLATSALHYITVFLYVYTVLGVVGVPVGSILAGAGLFGVALGFASRDLVADMINGFFVIVERQVNVGDTVRFENLNMEGVVKAVGIRSITIKATDGAIAYIPNRNVESLKNYSTGERSILLDVPVVIENLAATKAKIIKINEQYEQVKFVGIVNIEEKLFVRSQLTASLEEIYPLKQKITNEYYEMDELEN